MLYKCLAAWISSPNLLLTPSYWNSNVVQQQLRAAYLSLFSSLPSLPSPSPKTRPSSSTRPVRYRTLHDQSLKNCQSPDPVTLNFQRRECVGLVRCSLRPRSPQDFFGHIVLRALFCTRLVVPAGHEDDGDEDRRAHEYYQQNLSFRQRCWNDAGANSQERQL